MAHTRNGNDPRPPVIEFIGGPYDGHKEPYFTQTARLPADVVWCVCDDAFRVLEGKESQPDGSITSVALYRLAVTNGAPLYRFHPSEPILIGAGGGDSGGILAFWDLQNEKPIHKANPKGHLQQFVLDAAKPQILAAGYGGFQIWNFDKAEEKKDEQNA